MNQGEVKGDRVGYEPAYCRASRQEPPHVEEEFRLRKLLKASPTQQLTIHLKPFARSAGTQRPGPAKGVLAASVVRCAGPFLQGQVM